MSAECLCVCLFAIAIMMHTTVWWSAIPRIGIWSKRNILKADCKSKAKTMMWMRTNIRFQKREERSYSLSAFLFSMHFVSRTRSAVRTLIFTSNENQCRAFFGIFVSLAAAHSDIFDFDLKSTILAWHSHLLCCPLHVKIQCKNTNFPSLW